MNKNTLEWTVFAGSLVLILFVAGTLLYSHFTTGQQPPSITVTFGEPVRSGDAYALPMEIRNEGDVTAEDVRIEVVLSGAGLHERSEAVLAIVPYHSRRRAWVTFMGDPARGTVRSRVLGYQEP